MSSRTLPLTESLYKYLLQHSLRESPIAASLRNATEKLTEFNMQIAAEQGQLMALLARLMGVQRAIEIGTFTGYSALCVAQQLPEDGLLIACDVSTEWTNIAQAYWEEAGVQSRIDLRIAPALETLEALLAEGQQNSFDWMFIDADKENYSAYYDRGFELIRPGGLILFDNVFWGGAVADQNDQTPDTLAIRALNKQLKDDPRIELSMLPIGDGLTLALKK